MENSDITLPASHIMDWSDQAQKLFEAFKSAENKYIELQQRNGELSAIIDAARNVVMEIGEPPDTDAEMELIDAFDAYDKG